MRGPAGASSAPSASAALLARSAGHQEMIRRSHERCATLGLSRIEQPDFSRLPRADLTLARERNQRLHLHAAPVMAMLYEQITDTESMVVLCDATGTVIHSIGDADFLDRAAAVALAPGANWSEPAKGTNAVGTALVAETATLVHADEHYLHANHFLTCSAAPILDSRGNILGVLDVSGDQRGYHRHTMALVTMSARMIENQWLSDHHHDTLRLHFHSRPAFLGTLMDGILALTPDGRIAGANRGAFEQLGLSGVALRMRTLSSLFDVTVAALVDHFRSPLAPPLEVHDSAGRRFFVRARFEGPAPAVAPVPSHPAMELAPVAEAAPALLQMPRPASAPAAGSSALRALCSGDEAYATAVARLERLQGQAINVLIVAETGSGKDQLARALHADSPRATQPLVTVGAADTAAALHAACRRVGSGTLLLDEVGEFAPALQQQLLHELAASPDRVVIATSQRDLRPAIDAGRFREDLFQRLAGVCVRLPALRARSDLPALVHTMLQQIAGERAAVPEPALLAWLQRQAWPGNLRQLFNLLRTAQAMAGDDGVLRLEHLGEDLVRTGAETPAGAPAAVARLDQLEDEAIRQALAAEGGNISAAARRLGVSRNTVYRRLR